MKMRIAGSAALCLWLIAFIGGAQAQSYERDEKEITALMDRQVAAVNAKDIDALMKVYVPAVIAFDMVPPRQYAGYTAYRKDLESILSLKALKFWVTDLSITTDGVLAYSHSIDHTSGVGPKGEPFELTTRKTDAYRKIDGQWYIVLEHVSVPVDTQTGKPDFTSRP
jgi:ketosteroid isomerase-like protein